ncbi:MAG: Holliday junction resolvase RuvX [Acidobacteria bacterium]|nr:Holliday junction resolvase RuvX [Acidobacteriota bacterium]
MRLLGIDYGTRAVGLAITDELRLTARPLATIRVNGRGRRFIAAEIRRYVAEYEVAELVVGLPLNMDGTLGAAAERVIKFIDFIRNDLALPVHTVDERLTSRAAEDRLRASGLAAAERRERSDEYAALIILEDFLAINVKPEHPGEPDSDDGD